MKVPTRLRRFLAVAIAALIAFGAFALVSHQATAEDVPSHGDVDWG